MSCWVIVYKLISVIIIMIAGSSHAPEQSFQIGHLGAALVLIK